ncbi:B12-binding domain-containing radical SAM protein [Caenispirillum bisanense]|uniref:B12-binding domain-containing radical SAM protein n=1 Tax=Caenispirillum bisanense TaxID=414052 RepID=UPI0031D29C3E
MSGKPVAPHPLVAVPSAAKPQAALRPAVPLPLGLVAPGGARPGQPAPTADELLGRAVEQWQRGARAEAESTAAKALGIKGRAKPADRARILTTLAERLYFADDFVEAAEAAGLALKLDKGATHTRLIRAAALRGWGPLEEAEREARAAVKAAPTALEATDGLVAVLLDQGRPEDAEAAVRALLARAPRASGAHALLARLLRRRGRYDEAAAALQAALACPDAQRARLEWVLGTVLHDAGRHDEAAAAYRRSIALAPKIGDGWAALVNTLQAAGRHDEAAETVRQARAAVPGYEKRFLDLLWPSEPVAIPDAPVDGRRVILVNGFGHYPSIPLGIPLIKGYVTEKGEGYRVTCMDVNAGRFDSLYKALRDGVLHPSFTDREDFVAAATLFRDGGPEFHQPEAYDRHLERFIKFFSLFLDNGLGHTRRADGGGAPLPWWVIRDAERIVAERPGVVGISVTYTDQIPYSVLLARAIRRIDPTVRIVFGGGFFKAIDMEGFLAEAFVDYVVLNAGEAAFLALLEALNAGTADLPAIPGLAFRDPADGRFHISKDGFPVDYNTQPFADFRDFDPKAYFVPDPVYPVLSSRGCYWRRCTFCNHFASYAGTYKTQAIDRVVAEMKHLQETLGAKLFTFVDEMISAKRFWKISTEILAQGLDVHYYALAKPTRDFTPDILEKMHEAGCRAVYWGLESGSERVLALMDKGNDAEGSEIVLRRSSEAGIRNHCFMIIGFPTETRDDLRDTLAFMHRNSAYVDQILAGHFVLEPGTPIHDRPQEFGMRKVYYRRSLCGGFLVGFEPDGWIDQPTAARYAEILRDHFFDLFSPRGRYFGTPREHIVAVYAEEPKGAPRPGKRLPSVAELERMLDDPRQVPQVKTFDLQPVW